MKRETCAAFIIFNFLIVFFIFSSAFTSSICFSSFLLRLSISSVSSFWRLYFCLSISLSLSACVQGDRRGWCGRWGRWGWGGGISTRTLRYTRAQVTGGCMQHALARVNNGKICGRGLRSPISSGHPSVIRSGIQNFPGENQQGSLCVSLGAEKACRRQSRVARNNETFRCACRSELGGGKHQVTFSRKTHTCETRREALSTAGWVRCEICL